MERTILRRGSMMLLMVMMALMMCCGISFADEIGSTVKVQITAGEHGTVNGHTGSFTETVTSGSDLILDCQADEGYVIGSVIVNDAEVESEDLSGILQQLKGKLTLEELTTDLSLTVNFIESGAEPVAPAEDETSTDIGADDTEDSSDADTDISDAEDMDANTDTEEEPVDIDLGDDEATNAEIQGTGSEDEPGSPSTGEDATEEIDLDDSGETGGEEAQPGQTEPEVTDDETAAEEEGDQTLDQKQESTEEKAKEQTDDKAKAEADQEGKGDDDTYVSDDSPKTGDAFHMPVILAMLASLCTLAAIAIRQLLRKRHEEV